MNFPDAVLDLVVEIRKDSAKNQLASIDKLKALVNSHSGNFILSYHDNYNVRYITLNNFSLNNLRTHFVNKDEQISNRTGEYLDEFFVNTVKNLKVDYLPISNPE